MFVKEGRRRTWGTMGICRIEGEMAFGFASDHSMRYVDGRSDGDPWLVGRFGGIREVKEEDERRFDGMKAKGRDRLDRVDADVPLRRVVVDVELKMKRREKAKAQDD